jgi:RNA polymerase sigma-70 factor (ECF subfamily)
VIAQTGVGLKSIEAIYRGQFASFLHVASAITHDVELGADAVQEAFASAVLHRRDFRRGGSLEGWLWRILVNTARDIARREKRQRAAMSLANHRPQAERADGLTADERLRSHIARLPERERLVLFLRYYADLDYQQIAEALHIRPGTVGATLNAAHAALRPLLEKTEVPQR